MRSSVHDKRSASAIAVDTMRELPSRQNRIDFSQKSISCEHKLRAHIDAERSGPMHSVEFYK